jgi:hypothetical protein
MQSLYAWQNEWEPEFKAEGPSRCTIELEPEDNSVTQEAET